MPNPITLKEKDHKNTNVFCRKSAWKTAHFDANCMAIRFLLLKILGCYVFKMAANEGCHFEINILTEDYRTQFYFTKVSLYIHF